jgi:peptidoglycan/LPS O-acetylase OafA/YrhL
VLLAGLFLANITHIFGVAIAYGPLWSLAVEEQYYLLWPAVVRNVPALRLAFVAATLFALAPLIRWIAFNHGYGESELYFYTWFAYDGLVLGALIAALLRTAAATRTVVTSISLITFALSIAALAVGAPHGLLTRTTSLGAALEYTTVNLFFGSALVVALLIGTSDRRSVVVRPWLMFFGYISYGLYLCHLLIFQMYDRLVSKRPVPALGDMLIRFAVASTLSILVAWLSRRYYEERFLRLKRVVT